MNGRTCGAKTRRGGACQRAPVPGKRRCSLHGGRSTGPRTPEGRARAAAAPCRHGIYARTLDPEEVEAAEAAGEALRDELLLSRCQLVRALRAQEADEGRRIEALPADERYVTDGAQGLSVTVKQRRPDWLAVVDRLLSRVGRLAEARARILALQAGASAHPEPQAVADEVRRLLGEIDEATAPGAP